MAVKRRIIWMTDEEWAVLQKVAKDRGETISGVLRNFWQVAAATRGDVQVHQGTDATHARPFTPAPKPSQRKK